MFNIDNIREKLLLVEPLPLEEILGENHLNFISKESLLNDLAKQFADKYELPFSVTDLAYLDKREVRFKARILATQKMNTYQQELQSSAFFKDEDSQTLEMVSREAYVTYLIEVGYQEHF
ncbi:hypothetical protein [Entomospira culicis]|uniref:Uncharacterized protein n=1 Tax=Entomospira culicis TaxID=2719989 RepID=A0A968GFC1_9SPIO|nr:hypothetical protein [Entomospira culicis]NIZ19591.1 hypothetical protein [Entomospira culicis]NIZ69504.1 hypothetical protein [Entomospira culicis]WDI36619.1 hypothetical protein PVA46_04650 [Entomospira culicis]WDI38247.1 hypothetical protein PVA47_04660 [Entomospira culicis]